MVCRFCALSMRSFVRLPLFSLFDLFQLQLSVKRMAKAQSECVYVVMVVVVCCELLPFCRVALCIMQLNRKMFFSFFSFCFLSTTTNVFTIRQANQSILAKAESCLFSCRFLWLRFNSIRIKKFNFYEIYQFKI